MATRKRLSDRVAEFFRAQQRYPVGREYTRLAEQHEIESDIEDSIEGISHARDVIDDTFKQALSPAEYAALRQENVRVALASEPTADGSVQVRMVPDADPVEPKYRPPTLEERQHKAAVEAEASQHLEAQRQLRAQERQQAWTQERKRIIERQEKYRRHLLLHGEPNQVPSYMVEPPLSAPSWFQNPDGKITYRTLEPVVKRTAEGQQLDFTVSPLTGRPLNAAEPPKSPEQTFSEEQK